MTFSRRTLHISFQREIYNKIKEAAENDERKMTDWVKVLVNRELKRLESNFDFQEIELTGIEKDNVK